MLAHRRFCSQFELGKRPLNLSMAANRTIHHSTRLVAEASLGWLALEYNIHFDL
jgi:hypothetical protein